MKALLLIIILIFFINPSAYAAKEGDVYGGIQYAMVTYDEEGFDEAEPTALVGKLGQFVNDNFAIEGRFGIGLQDDSVDVGPFDIDVEVESLLGIYGVFQANSSSDTSFYGVIGFSKGELEASAFGVSISEDESGLSFGFGVNIKSFNIEYMSYLDEDEFDATAISLGFVTTF